MAEQEALIRVLKTGMSPPDCIGIGKHQVRTRRVSDNLEPLKNSMTKFGQLAAKAISLTENEMRKSVLHADIVKACTDFYKLGSAKAVSEELALSYRLILNAIKLPRCSTEVQNTVKDGHKVTGRYRGYRCTPVGKRRKAGTRR